MRKKLIMVAFMLGLMAPVAPAQPADTPASEAADAGAPTTASPSDPGLPAVAEPATTPAAEVPAVAPSEPEPELNDIQSAYKNGEVLLAIMLLVYFLTKYMRLAAAHFWSWPNSKWGGATIAFFNSSALAAAVYLKTGMGLSLSVVITIVVAAWASSGLHGHVKDYLEHRLKLKTPQPQ